jgi:hypothetical protein
MIIKVPVYFELEGKFTPDEVGEIRVSLLDCLSQDLIHITSNKFKWKIYISGKGDVIIKPKVLLPGEVIGRLTGQ